MALAVGDSGLCHLFYVWRKWSAVSCLSLVILSSKPGVCQKTALHASSTTMNCTWLILPSEFIQHFFQLPSPHLLQLDTADADIKAPFGEKPRLSKAVSCQAGVGQNVVCQASFVATPLHFPHSGVTADTEIKVPSVENWQKQSTRLNDPKRTRD